MKKECRFCKKEIEYRKIQQYAGHISNCKENPDRNIRHEKTRVKLLGKKRASNKVEYTLNCKKCNKEYKLNLTELKYKNERYTKHCSRACANSHIRTEESKKKTSESAKSSEKVKLANCIRKKNKDEFVERKCICCEKKFRIRFRSIRKTCSKVCRVKCWSKSTSERLTKAENRGNYGRHKKSYLELSFESWLKQNNVSNYETEKKFFNCELKKNYFTDFVFESKKLIIELDGTQHKNTIEQDKTRDEFLTRVLGYKVLRITHKEYKDQTKTSLIKELLNIT